MKIENCADPIEFAANLSDAMNESNVQAARNKAAPKQVKIFGPVKQEDGTSVEMWHWPQPDCLECGEPIPEDRLDASGALHCIDCAELLEKKGNRYARR